MIEIRDLIDELVKLGVPAAKAGEIIAKAAIVGARSAPRKRMTPAERTAKWRDKKRMEQAA